MFRTIFLFTALLTGFTSLHKAAAQQKDTAVTRTSATATLSENQKIDLLLDSIRGLEGATCIRNGSRYAPADAADHLQAKREKHSAKITTAADFIQYLATKSSASGEYYTIQLSDGRVVRLGDMLMRELKKIEGQ